MNNNLMCIVKTNRRQQQDFNYIASQQSTIQAANPLTQRVLTGATTLAIRAGKTRPYTKEQLVVLKERLGALVEDEIITGLYANWFYKLMAEATVPVLPFIQPAGNRKVLSRFYRAIDTRNFHKPNGDLRFIDHVRMSISLGKELRKEGKANDELKRNVKDTASTSEGKTLGLHGLLSLIAEKFSKTQHMPA